MKVIKFIAKENREMGYVGFVPSFHMAWWEKTDSYMPILSRFGHDLLHHRQNETGSVEHEFRALGAGAWMSGFFTGGSLTLDGLQSDFITTLHTGYYDTLDKFDSDIPDAPKYGKISRLDTLTLEDVFDDAFDGMEKSLKAEIQGGFWVHEGSNGAEILEAEKKYNEETERISEWVARNRENLFGWFAYGFWHAEKVRYKGFSAYQVQSVYNQLDRLAYKDIEEGERLIIRYDMASNQVSAARFAPDYGCDY